ncbi:hypothetical protein CSB93_4494 [Pseudomonas paraeruginosa]|uniref:Uncharacterized protein n=1 Tax=Pseudomonas paraeruginosa TaxID=2994495 RepID=A0A2R3IY79_9PSED|nr:hypothetical protein CSB93_4494 [Pseudomonas paraeruginosa]
MLGRENRGEGRHVKLQAVFRREKFSQSPLEVFILFLREYGLFVHNRSR